MEEGKKMKCYKRLRYQQFFKVSGLCGRQFLSYWPKRFMHLCRALYGDAILVYRFEAQMAAGNQQKHVEFTFSIKALSFHSRTSMRAHKHIFYQLNWNGYTAENQRYSIPILVSRTVKTRKFKLPYFRNETCCGNGNMYKDLLFFNFNST